MDYAWFVATLKDHLAPLANSDRFEFQSTIYQGMPLSSIDALETAIVGEDDMAGFHIPEDMKRFYEAANGLYVHWVDREPDEWLRRSDGASVTYQPAGLATISSLPQIYALDEPGESRARAIYDRYKLFDRADGWDQVALRFDHDHPEPEFYLHERDTARYQLLSLDIGTYMEVLLETRALAGWQEFFIADPSYQIEPAKAEWFRNTLHRFFPDVDVSPFHRKAMSGT